jgi:hypothetical protein
MFVAKQKKRKGEESQRKQLIMIMIVTMIVMDGMGRIAAVSRTLYVLLIREKEYKMVNKKKVSKV